MRRTLKIVLISLLTILLLCSITIGIALWVVFTPARLTPIVQKEVDKRISCSSKIGSVELTFFSTFPNFGLKIEDLSFINPMDEAPCDTLFKANEIVVSIDINAFRKEDKILLNAIDIESAKLCAFVDSLGKANFDILPADNDSSSNSSSEIVIKRMSLKNSYVSYIDEDSKINTEIQNLSGKLAANMLGDSLYTELQTEKFLLSFEFDKERYLQEATVKIDTRLSFNLANFRADIEKFVGSLNALPIELTGTAQYEKETGASVLDLSYKLASSSITDILDLAPENYKTQLQGIEISGFLASEGEVKGVYGDSIFPWIDARISFEDGHIKHPEIPLPLHILKSDYKLYTNLEDDKESYFRVNNFEARTPYSKISSSGLVNQLFSDISTEFTSQVVLSLFEFNSMIPVKMKANVKGNATGTIKSKFTMSQFEKDNFEKMNFSGNLVLSNFIAHYDSLSLSTDRSKIRFEMPNKKAKTPKTKFAFFELVAENLDASKLDDYNVKMKSSTIKTEFSNVLDTTRIPNILCVFEARHVKAQKEDMDVALTNPSGNVAVSPQTSDLTQPDIKLVYNGDSVEATKDKDSFSTKSVNADLSIRYDSKQEDLIRQWMPKGSFKMGEGKIVMDSFFFPIEVSGADLKSDSERLVVERSVLKIDESDFEISGTINNLNSYLKGDSILRADLNFASNLTNLAQLMTLTDGLGSDDYAPNEEDLKNNSFSGPYMIPQKIDVLLHTSVNKVLYGTTIATDIRGDLRVLDGLLVMDGMSFSTPAADMQLTAMYRTPRRNHLFVGMDLHMLDIEIKELQRLLPDLDSIMPMLRSFDGNGEFHLAVEVYTDSLYNPKMSTLRGISSIRGENLVLMDGETFSEIAKKLHFNKKTKNKIDSLSVEFTVFRKEVDVYPFLIVMDKYKAIVSGRHNLDLTYDYHISVVQSPLPFRLGLNVSGSEDNLSFKLTKPLYTDTSRPAQRKEFEIRQLQLRETIRQELQKKVVRKK